jgi:hypothetical protein
MRRLWHSWLALALIVLIIGGSEDAAHAAGLNSPSAVTVIRQFGAALRVIPSSDAAVKKMVGCGAYLRVIGQNAGWYHVSYTDAVTPTLNGWVGKARVGAANTPLSRICANAVTFQIGEHVYTKVASGCLSLRVIASRNAVYYHCVSNYHDYAIVNGPIGVSQDDWFQVTSSSTGTGWALAQYLRPYAA